MTEKLYQDKDWLYEQYWVQSKSTTEMAEIAGCGKSAIQVWMEKFGIPRRTSAEGIRLKARNPAWLKKVTEAARRRSKDPEWRKAQVEGARRKSKDPAWQKAHAKAAHRRAQDPAWQKAHAEGIYHRSQDPEWRKNVAEAARRRARDPSWRKANAKAIHRRAQDPVWRKAQAARNRRLAQDPAWQKAHTEGIRHANRRLALKRRNQGQMTGLEAICHTAFEALGLDFVFEKFIYPYRVDFFFPSHGIIVEAYGKYWHSKPKRRKRDIERKQYLEASGYVVLEWWGPDIKADVWHLIEEELLPLLDQPSRMERPPRGVSKPYRGPHGWRSAIQLSLFGKEPDD